MIQVELPLVQCRRCGHKWNPRSEFVYVCPNKKCHNTGDIFRVLRGKRVKKNVKVKEKIIYENRLDFLD